MQNIQKRFLKVVAASTITKQHMEQLSGTGTMKHENTF